jgi:cytochrome P450 PksS
MPELMTAPVPQMRDLDLSSPRFKANPYPLYAQLRAEAPVHHTRLPDGRDPWLVVRYDDAAQVLKDARFAKDRRNVVPPPPLPRVPFVSLIRPLLRPLEFNMLDQDPPDHTRLRGLVHKAFTPRLVEHLRSRIESLTEELLDAVAHTRRFDLVSAYALPIPSVVIADLLGVPASDRHRFHRWSSRMISISSGRDLLLALPSALLFMRYARRLITYRRRQPSDDLVSALVQAEEAGDRLSSDELVSMIVLLLIAGHETTVNLIACGTLALLEYPDQLERLRQAPALMGPAVEELLRYTSPVQVATERYALDDVEVSGTTIPRGGLTLVLIGSANHDERVFSRPDELDLIKARSPGLNPHLAFGQGAHYCLGAPLARLEGQIAFMTLLRRLPRPRLAVSPEALRWRRGIFVRGLEELPITALD